MATTSRPVSIGVALAISRGARLRGAGLNLKWVEDAGAVPIQSSLRDACTAMQTGAYDGWIIFPSAWLNHKLFELGKFYTEVGFGAVTWHGLTINKARFEKLARRRCRTSSLKSAENMKS